MGEDADRPGGEPSKTQLDKLGDRLRAGSRDQADLRALDQYRRSFRKAFELLLEYFSRPDSPDECTGRPAKTTTAIVEKLNRQRIRLTQIQDIAGFRVVVGNVLEQNRAVAALRLAFPNTSVEDRRLKPSHGYRAVHVIISINQRSVEVQVRTHEQHLWAELSEKLSDVVDSALKYGGGPVSTRETLLAYSRLVAEIEALEVAQFSSGTSLAEKESRFVDQMPNDPDWQVTAEILNQLRATQIEAEDATRGAKKLLAGLLTDYYNDLRQKP